MTADVNLQGVTLIPVGGGWPYFNGIFDGNGHIIRNADINMPHSGAVGLFGYSNGQIRNLGVVDVNISGYGTIGGLVGYNNGTIATCYATGSVNGNEDVGGLVGWNGRLGPTITDCYATATVTGSNRVGGLAGSNFDTITNCYATGAVSGKSCVGGLVGNNDDTTISNCYATGEVNGINFVGGLVGWNLRTITSCYATGTVTGTAYSIGGLVGGNGDHVSHRVGGRITTCYAFATVDGNDYVGGLVGDNWYSPITACYSAGAVTGNNYTGGLVGGGYQQDDVTVSFWDIETSDCNISFGGTGKTTAEMKTRSTFTDAGWDFIWETINGPNDIWAICGGVSYPKLNWQFVLGDSDNDKDVDFLDFGRLSLKWQQADANLYCGGTDLTGDGVVNMLDFATFADNWLEGI